MRHLLHENKIAGSQLVTTNLITPAASSLCTKICTVPVKHICGSTTNDVYAFYQNDDNQGNKKEMPTEMFSIKMTAPDPITNLMSVCFLTLYFGLMFFSGWMNEGEAVFLSVIIVMMNLFFTLWSFRVIFNEQITEWLESRNVVKVAKGTKKRSGSGSKISPITDNDMAKQNAEKAWELDSDDDGKKGGMGGE